MIINLRDFYPYYTCDALVDVSDEIGAVLLESKREGKNYWNRLGYRKAYYSLYRGDGIEYDTVEKPMTPEEALIHSNRQIIMRSDIKLPQPFASWGNSL